MFYPRGPGFRRMGLAIAILTLGGVLSFGLGQALGHQMVPAASRAHSAPASPQPRATADSSLIRQEAVPPQPQPVSYAPSADQHTRGHQGEKEHHDSPPPKADGSSGGGGGNNGGG